MRLLGCLLCVVLVAAGAPGAEGFWLVSRGEARCGIVRGAQDEYAAKRLQHWLVEQTGVEVGVTAVDKAPARADCVVVMGTIASNPLLRRIANALSMDVSAKTLTGQGYMMRTARHEGRDWVILAGGGPDGTRYAVADLINWRLERDGAGVRLPHVDTKQIPRFRYRWFWNWDHRMDWGGAGCIGSVMGGGGTFSKEPEAFLADFKRCVDYTADHKFNGLIIWGFLRDTHGGVEASQELCRYARERGVRILPGVGTSGYAGYYFEGNHPYNAHTWLAEHPELRAIDENGKPKNAPCPSKKANQEWLDDGAQWLFNTFDISGVNLEMGDFFVCHCDDCKKARAAIPSDEPDYYKDMAISHSVTLRKMRALAPDAWLSYATYTGYTAEMMHEPPRFLSIIPEDAVCQWTLTGMARNWPADVRPMARHNLGYLHWCNRSTHTEDDFYLERVRAICRQADAAGFEGLDTYGELSPERPNVELFYLAWEAFLWDPEMTIEEFAKERLARLYGGEGPARKLLELLPLVQTQKKREVPENLLRALELAKAARAEATPNGQPRWDRLVAYLERHEVGIHARREANRRQETAARQGRKLPVASVAASDEDLQKGWLAHNAVDGNVEEPAGYWLTRYAHPKQAWLELTLAEPSKVNRVVLFHQLNPRHYRSLDYTVRLRVNGEWLKPISVKDNSESGWIAHPIEAVVASAARLEITRSAYGNRMGIGEMELRYHEAR